MPAKTQQKPSTSAYDVNEAIQKLRGTKFHTFADFNQGTIGVFRAGKGISPWERHPDMDEFLYVLEGYTKVTVLHDDGSRIHTRLDAGSFFIVPKGLWHRHDIPESVVELWVTPGSTEHSKEENPLAAGSKQAKKAAPQTIKESEARSKSVSKTKRGSVAPTANDFVTQIREYALSFPEAYEDHPWDHSAFKVKNKTFAWLSFREGGINFTAKLTHSRLHAEELPFTEPSGYGLGQHGWITARIDPADGSCPIELVKHWLDESYRNVAPKAILKQLPLSDNHLPGTGLGPGPGIEIIRSAKKPVRKQELATSQNAKKTNVKTLKAKK